ncbi:MAG: RsmE family RNA methyltransferase [Kiritimatiellaeota bacterium]|nr:RsmE family RNA methyltransferase [Kiritimatiellota bacterium]
MKPAREHLRCFVAPAAWQGTALTVDETEAHHLVNVLRARVSERVEVFDGAGRTGFAEVAAIAKRGAELRLLEQNFQPRPAPELILVQALPREATMDFIVQKAVELGASAIFPVLSERCIVRLTPDQYAEKSARWQRIALNAARQSHAAWLLHIAEVQTFEKFFQTLEEPDCWFVGSLAAHAMPLRAALAAARAAAPHRAAALIGPEGDFTPDEYRAAEAAGAVPVTFGTNVLRSDTAAFYALSALKFSLTD